MGLDKKSKKADAIANLYRAAFFLARGKRERELAFELVEKSAQELKKPALSFLLKKYSDRRLLAEKLLDQYLLLK